MNVKLTIERFLARYGFKKIPGGSGSGGGLAGFLGFTNVGSREEQLKAYQNHVYKCVTVIYRRAMSIGWKLFKERAEEDQEVRQHPFIDLMYRPNPYMSGAFLKAITQMHLDLTGMAFWLKIRNGLARPAELWPLSPALFSRFILNDDRTDLIGYEFRTDTGGFKTYRPEDIVYFHYPHPLYWLDGASPIQAMAHSYDIDLASRIYQRNFFQNSARPDLVFESDQEIGEDDAKRLLLNWIGAHRGVNKSWEPAVLDKGLKAHILSANAKDMEFVSLAGWTKQDILEAYNVPEGKLGTVIDVNKANALGIDITFNSECIKPRLTLFDETVTMFVLADYDTGLYMEHDECVPRDDEFDLRERESNLRNKVTTINEERNSIGLKDVPWGSAPWISIAEFQYGDEPVIIQESQGSEVRDQRSEGDGEEDSPLLGLRGGQGELRRPGAAAMRLLHERQVAARSKQYRTYLRKFFRGQEEKVQENLRQFFPRIEGAVAGMSIGKTRLWIAKNQPLFDRINLRLDQADKDLADGSKPFLQAALQSAGDAALTQIGAVDVVFDLTNPRVLQWLGENTGRIRDVNRTTHAAIDQALREGFEAGEGMAQIAERITEVFDQADKTRSLRIAQTQVNGAANTGTLEGYEQSGVVEKKEWIAGPGARASHQAAAKRYKGDGAIPVGQDFEVGAGRGPCPGRIGLPEEDINCRCTILPVLAKR